MTATEKTLNELEALCIKYASNNDPITYERIKALKRVVLQQELQQHELINHLQTLVNKYEAQQPRQAKLF